MRSWIDEDCTLSLNEIKVKILWEMLLEVSEATSNLFTIRLKRWPKLRMQPIHQFYGNDENHMILF